MSSLDFLHCLETAPPADAYHFTIPTWDLAEVALDLRLAHKLRPDHLPGTPALCAHLDQARIMRIPAYVRLEPEAVFRLAQALHMVSLPGAGLTTHPAPAMEM